jgi:hypothetical protein
MKTHLIGGPNHGADLIIENKMPQLLTAVPTAFSPQYVEAHAEVPLEKLHIAEYIYMTEVEKIILYVFRGMR